MQAVLDINWILVISSTHNSISTESGYVEDPPGHLDSSWTTSRAVQISRLGGEARLTYLELYIGSVWIELIVAETEN